MKNAAIRNNSRRSKTKAAIDTDTGKTYNIIYSVLNIDNMFMYFKISLFFMYVLSM